MQEGAYTLADASVYIERCLARGLAVDDFAPRISFYFYTHSDFFEEIAKYRAMRRLWAKILKDRFGAENPRSLLFRFGTVCGGSTLTAAEPENNIVRVAIEALSAVLGGAQTIFTCAYDEAMALPTEESALLALRTQQILAEETGVANVADPFGGSYYLENLTARMAEEMEKIIAGIESAGGMVRCIESGQLQRWIAESAFQFQKEVDAGARPIVGVNKYAEAAPAASPPVFRVDPALAERQKARLARIKKERDAPEAALARLKDAARGTVNLMDPIAEAVSAYATLGEMTAALKEVFGEFREPAGF